ncbi:MAG: hypothetical protein WKF43_14320 [Acidimicrobiales bacterium]
MTHVRPDGEPAPGARSPLAVVLADVEASSEPSTRIDAPAPNRQVAVDTGSQESEPAVEPPADGPDGISKDTSDEGEGTPPRRRWRVHRRALFASVLVLLIGAIPTLGYLGARTLRDSRAGQVLNPVTDPRAGVHRHRRLDANGARPPA